MRTCDHPPRTPTASLVRALFFALQAASVVAQDEQDELEIDVTRPVTCARASRNGDQLSMHYNGTLTDGTLFDSSHNRGVPFTFILGQGNVIKGWDYGLVDMCPGEERLLTIPPTLGYGHRDLGDIPPDSVLIFETKLVHIEGVEDEPLIDAPPAASSNSDNLDNSDDISGDTSTASDDLAGDFSDDLLDDASDDLLGDTSHDTLNEAVDMTEETQEQQEQGNDDGPVSAAGSENGECKLLGPFALVVQGALGLLAMVSLVFKRWRERPRRPLKIWFFDASKQVFGSALLHVFNVLMSMLSSGAVELATQAQAAKGNPDANPCSFYLINIAVDTTIGIPILVLLLKVLHQAALVTPLANPPESIKSGYYGEPPKASWWLKQALIYSIGLLLMKLCVFFIFGVLPWIVWVGNWALRWTEGSEALQIAFVMFVFPLIMNAIQYYIVDTFIKDQSKEPHGHEAVPSDEDEDDETAHINRQLQDEDSDDEHELGGEATHDATEADKDGISEATGSKVMGEEERRR